MQYIFTEEEYKTLLENKEKIDEKKTNKLLNVCINVADTMPITYRNDKHGIQQPWGCMITYIRKGVNQEWYCDQCPVNEICPYEGKRFSK